MGTMMMSTLAGAREQQGGVGLTAENNNEMGSHDPEFSDFSAFAMSLENSADQPALDSLKFEDLISIDNYNTTVA